MSKLKHLLSLLMIAVLLVSTMSFSIGRHYCMGKMVSQALNESPASCMMTADEHCNDTPQDKTLADDCCESRQIVFHGLDLLTFQKHNAPLLPPALLNLMAASLPVPPAAVALPAPLHIVLPDRPGRSILIAHQVFRI